MTEVVVNPTYIGSNGDSDIYRVDLSTLNIETIRSIMVQDDNIVSAGRGGASGFDLDAIKISTTNTSTATDVNSLPTLDVFDFSESSVGFQPGFFQPIQPGDPDLWVRNTLFGTTEDGTSIDLSRVTFDQVDGDFTIDQGFVSIGESGWVTFSLNQAISPDGHYLYIADAGRGDDLKVVLSSEETPAPRPGLILIGLPSGDVIDLRSGLNSGIGLGNDIIRALAGDDFINGGAGDDTLRGYAGDDEIYGGRDDDRLLGGTGDDTVYGNAGSDRLLGWAGNDELYGGTARDTIRGGTGDDFVWGGEGKDWMSGDQGNDILVGNSGNDRLFGEAGDDALFGNAGFDRLNGGIGDDLLQGGGGDDYLVGGEGSDIFAIARQDSEDFIADFTIGEDQIQLLGGIDVDAVEILGGVTETYLVVDDITLATLANVNSGDLVANAENTFI